MSPKAQHTSPFMLYGTIAILLSIGVALPLYIWLSWSLLISWLISINLVTFLSYGFDKMRAKGGGLRVPENVLHGLVIIGGGVGGLGGMVLFHHKTRKGKFQLVFWPIVALQIAVACVWLIVS